MEIENKRKKLFTGIVVSDKMNKTIVVSAERIFRHPIFGKVLSNKKKYKVHDPKEEASIGDVIEFFEGRPVSKTKYMYFSRIIKKLSVNTNVVDKGV